MRLGTARASIMVLAYLLPRLWFRAIKAGLMLPARMVK